MAQETYTSIGTLDLKNNSISITTALPIPPIRSSIATNYYNISKKDKATELMINAILCEFTFYDDPGDELPTPTGDSITEILILNDIPPPAGLPGVIGFDFNSNAECLYLFFHNDDVDSSDITAIFDDLENLYKEAQLGSFVLCPAPTNNGNTIGRPRALGISKPIK